MKYLVQATAGPVFDTPGETAQLLEKLVLPSFDMLIRWEKANILTGGLPVGDRALVFVVEADTNQSLDAMLRSIPMWGMLQWEVTPLISFAERATIEREILKKIV